MRTKNATYREYGKVYRSDSCDPLIMAWRSGKVQLEAWAKLSYPGYGVSDKVLPGINTIGYWDANHTQEWGLGFHRNEGIEITFLETGSMSFSVEEEDFLLTSDNFTVTRPWQLHKVGNPNVGVGKLHWLILDVGVRHPHQEWKWPSWILLNKRDLEELSKMLRQNEQPVWKVNTEMKRCFLKIAQLIQNDRTAENESWVVIYINELLMHMLSVLRQGSTHFNESLTDSIRTVRLFIKHLKKNFHEPWTLDSMADDCDLGITRFVHYFRQLTNNSPMQYLNRLRVRAAAEQLTKCPERTVSHIGYDCGFSSSQYFATVFRKHFGCTPGDYREQKKGNGAKAN